MENNALCHHGTKGMRWGIRRYQNKDGSLTPAGQKRYNKEVEKLKKETAKVKAAEKLAANNKKVQAKFDKLDAKKAALEARKKALKDGKDPEEEKKKAEESEKETIEQKRERLLKSADAKELYENRALLTTNELNDRINRIDTEAKLNSRIVEEYERTAVERLKESKDKLDAAVNMYKSIDSAYSSLINSTIGKTLAKKLGLEPPKEEFNIEKLWAKRNKLSNKEIQDINQRLNNEKSIEDELKRREKKAKKEAEEAEAAKKEVEEAEQKAEQKAKEQRDAQVKADKEAKVKAEKEAAKRKKEEAQKQAQKQVDDYNKRWSEGKVDDKVTTSEYGNPSKSYRDSIKTFGIEQKATRWTDYDDADIIEPEWYTKYKSRNSSATPNSVNSSTRDNAEAFIFGYLEDRNGR